MEINKRLRTFWLPGLILLPVLGNGAGIEDLSPELAGSLPVDLLERLPESALQNVVLSAHLNPYYLQGDFDGDGRRDTAVLVRHKVSRKIGIAIFQSSQVRPIVVGAGTTIGSGGDDLSWMDAWQVKLKGPVEMGADETAPPTLKGDALLVIKTEASSALVYWNGSRFAWYQQGD